MTQPTGDWGRGTAWTGVGFLFLVEENEPDPDSGFWTSQSSLAAVASRTGAEKGQPRVEAWPEALSLGAELPTLPLWSRADLCLPPPLDASYTPACRSLRIGR
jgi:hypothetical protein